MFKLIITVAFILSYIISPLLGQEFFQPNPKVDIQNDRIFFFLSEIQEVDKKADYYNLSGPVMKTILVVQSNAGNDISDGQYNYARILPNKKITRFEAFKNIRNGFVLCEKRSRGIESMALALNFLRSDGKRPLSDREWLTMVFGPDGDLADLAAEADVVYEKLTGDRFADLGLTFGSSQTAVATTVAVNKKPIPNTSVPDNEQLSEKKGEESIPILYVDFPVNEELKKENDRLEREVASLQSESNRLMTENVKLTTENNRLSEIVEKENISDAPTSQVNQNVADESASIATPQISTTKTEVPKTNQFIIGTASAGCRPLADQIDEFTGKRILQYGRIIEQDGLMNKTNAEVSSLNYVLEGQDLWLTFTKMSTYTTIDVENGSKMLVKTSDGNIMTFEIEDVKRGPYSSGGKNHNQVIAGAKMSIGEIRLLSEKVITNIRIDQAVNITVQDKYGNRLKDDAQCMLNQITSSKEISPIDPESAESKEYQKIINRVGVRYDWGFDGIVIANGYSAIGVLAEKDFNKWFSVTAGAGSAKVDNEDYFLDGKQTIFKVWFVGGLGFYKSKDFRIASVKMGAYTQYHSIGGFDIGAALKGGSGAVKKGPLGWYAEVGTGLKTRIRVGVGVAF